MRARLLTPWLALLAASPAPAGPYSPAAQQLGSTAMHRSDPRFTAWANRAPAYAAGSDASPAWQDPTKSLGPATDDPTHVASLGSGGSITLSFPGFIHDGPGPDFAIFENSFSDTFLELAYVEVSCDGVHFTRFPNFSLTPNPVGPFGSIDPSDVQGLAGKFRQAFGEPFDLADLGLDQVSHVRLIDVIGDGRSRDSASRPIYDPFPVSGSAGFDLDAIGVIHLQSWQTLTVGQLDGTGVNATAFAHLPDGRFLLGAQGQLHIQAAWGQADHLPIASGDAAFDPAFIAVADANRALLGGGGSFGGATGLYLFDPSPPAPALPAAPLASLPNFCGSWWHSPASGRSGWIVGGIQSATGQHGLSFLTPSGRLLGPLVARLSTYSAAVAADSAGQVFAAQYELPGSPAQAAAEWVRRFSPAQIDAAIVALESGQTGLSGSQGTPVFQFDSASSLAVDAQGRLWASGFKTPSLQVFDPTTGASRRLQPDALPPDFDPLYQVQTFSRRGEAYVAFLASDLSGTPGSPLRHGLAPLSAFDVPETFASWQAFHFGPAASHQENNSQADPDGDGSPNLLEYAFHTPPLVPGPSPLVPGLSRGQATLSFCRHPLRTDLSYTVEASDHLAGPWITIAESARGQAFAPLALAAPAIQETALPPVVAVTLRDSSPPSSSHFLRLRLRLLP